MIHTQTLTSNLSTQVPESRAELKAAVDSCIKIFSPVGDCANGPHGPIGEWDVSHVTDMSDLFSDAALFNSDISNWDVSTVTTMRGMFNGATSFNIDISKWHVSSVTNMDSMFRGATSFARILCGAAWLGSKATKDYMLTGSSGGLCFGCENPTLMHTKTTSTHRIYCSAPPHSSHINRDLNNTPRSFPPPTSQCPNRERS